MHASSKLGSFPTAASQRKTHHGQHNFGLSSMVMRFGCPSEMAVWLNEAWVLKSTG